MPNNSAVSRPKKKPTSKRRGFGSFEVAGADSFSRWSFRSDFMLLVDGMRRNTTLTLYKKAFYLFVRLAWDEFPQAIPPSLSKWREDEGFLSELERIICDFSASPFDAERIFSHPAFADLLASPLATALAPFLERGIRQDL